MRISSRIFVFALFALFALTQCKPRAYNTEHSSSVGVQGLYFAQGGKCPSSKELTAILAQVASHGNNANAMNKQADAYLSQFKAERLSANQDTRKAFRDLHVCLYSLEVLNNVHNQYTQIQKNALVSLQDEVYLWEEFDRAPLPSDFPPLNTCPVVGDVRPVLNRIAASADMVAESKKYLDELKPQIESNDTAGTLLSCLYSSQASADLSDKQKTALAELRQQLGLWRDSRW